MPYHGIRTCSKCGRYGGFNLVRNCGRTGIVKCNHCGKEKRVKWSLYIDPRRFEQALKGGD